MKTPRTGVAIFRLSDLQLLVPTISRSPPHQRETSPGVDRLEEKGPKTDDICVGTRHFHVTNKLTLESAIRSLPWRDTEHRAHYSRLAE